MQALDAKSLVQDKPCGEDTVQAAGKQGDRII